MRFLRLTGFARTLSYLALLVTISPNIAAAAPAQVTNVQASEGTFADRIRISWSSASGASRYHIFRSTSSTDRCAGGYIGNPVATTTSFDDLPSAGGTNPSAGEVYYYTVHAIDILGQPGVCSLPNSGWRSPPDAPGAVSASDGTFADRIRVTWQHPPTGAPNGYKLYTSVNGSSCLDPTPINLSGSTTSYDLVGFGGGTVTHFTLRAVGPAGESGCSGSTSGYVGITLSGSLGTSGAAVALSGTSGLPACTVNGSNYSCAPIARGISVTVIPSKAGWIFSPPSQTVSNLQSNQTLNFSATANSFSISGIVTLNGSPLSGIQVNAGSLGTATTNSSGVYVFNNIPSGTDFILTPQPTQAISGYTPAGLAGTVTSNVTQNFVANPRTFSVSGVVTSNGLTLAGIQVALTPGGITTTDANGRYVFPQVAYGTSYIVTPQPTQAIEGYSPAGVTGTLSGNAVHNFVANPRTFSVSGVVTLNGTAISGVPVALTPGGIATTDAAGRYVFPQVVYGTNYIVTPQPTLAIEGYGPTGATGTLSGNAVHNFTATPRVFSISGTVMHQGSPLAGVTINGGVLGTRITSASGAYAFINIPHGSQYQISPSLSGYQFSPSSVAGTVTSNVIVNLVATLETYTISGRIAITDGTGLAGVVVSDGVRSTQSDDQGGYQLAGVPSGSYPLVASRVGFGILPRSWSNPVVVSGASVTGRDFDAVCVDGYILQNALCVPEDGAPLAPQNLVASDGESVDDIRVSWSGSLSGEAQYLLYRSEFAGELGVAVSAPISTTVFHDLSAIPGVTYYYSATALRDGKESVPSNQDAGFRADPQPTCFEEGGDNDGDGICDEQELIDGTDPNDRGSFQLHLHSPAYTKYNTFLDQLNFLELIASGTQPIDANITVFDINGAIRSSSMLHLDAGMQSDLDIHTVVGADTYGVIRISWEEKPGATVSGRMSHYRLDPGATSYSFAYAKELRNPTRGRTYATGNSYDPQGRGNLVPNWAEIVNLDSVTRAFTYNLYNQGGAIILSQQIIVPPYGERDIQAGHERGEGAYLSEFIPEDGASQYFATVTRYSSNAPGGTEATTYNFAFPLDARAGNGELQAAPITNLIGVCWSQTNWFEVVNVREKPVAATLVFRDASGADRGVTTTVLQPLTQYHFNASALLEKGHRGAVELQSSDRASLIAQSVTYFHDCADNRLQSAYAALAKIPGQDVQSGTFNTFLGMKNILSVLSLGDVQLRITFELRSQGAVIATRSHVLTGFQALEFDVSDAAIFGTPSDTYGTLQLRSAVPGVLIGENLRLREIGGRVDFAMPTAIQ